MINDTQTVLIITIVSLNKIDLLGIHDFIAKFRFQKANRGIILKYLFLFQSISEDQIYFCQINSFLHYDQVMWQKFII